ncbi:MAG TPA: AMP-binding protein [Burkholderiales bacterium]|nr:AMP-binding protein [Burkholderiales bacterium]
MVSLTQMLTDARPHGAVVAYTTAGALERRDFAALAERVAASASVQPQARWLLAAQNAFNFAAAFFGLLAAGKVVQVPPNFLPATLDAIGGGGAMLDDDAIEALALAAPQPRAIRGDAIVELYTSGSAGEPKRVVKRLGQLDAEVSVLEAAFGARLGDACVVSTVPHHHIYGLLFRILWPLAAGRAFDTALCSEPHTLSATLKRHDRCMLVSSPAQLSRLTGLMDLSRERERIAAVFSSGGPLAADAARDVAAALRASPIEVFGSTETGGIAWRQQSEGDLWTPLPCVAVSRAADSALVVRSHFADFGGERALPTADAIEIQADGRFRLLGRLDRIVKIEEKRVSLGELEARLREHPWVREAAAVLLASRRNVIGAAAVLAPEASRILDEQGRRPVVDALRAHLATRIESIALPRRWRFPGALPYDERGKLTRAGVAALFELPAA